MLKSLVFKLFLKREVNALKIRLCEASYALEKIEKSAVSIPKDAAPEVHALAAEMLQHVLCSADAIRLKGTGFAHPWEERAYKGYAAGAVRLESTVSFAHKLIDRTKIFFKK